jgi:hypothetical protein
MIFSKVTMKVAKILAFSFFFGTALGSTSSIDGEFNQQSKKAICHDQLNELLTKWGSSSQWVKRVPGDDGNAIFETPTQRIGFWIQVSFPPNRHSPKAIQRSNNGEINVSWTEAECAPQMDVKLNDKAQGAVSADFFTDQMLETEIKNNKAGIIYGWSPMMPLSIIGYNEAKSVAKKMKLDFIPVLDPMVDLEAAKTAINDYKIKEGIRKVGSVELLERGLNLHYPSILFFSQGKMVGSLLPGYWDNPKALEDAIHGQIGGATQ